MKNDWPIVRAGDVLQLQRRWITLDAIEDYVEIGVRSYGRGIFHKQPVSGASLGNKRVLRICPGDLVFMNVFAWEGAVGVASPAEVGKIGSHRFATFTPKNGAVEPRFLQLYFQTEAGRELLGRVSPGSAGRNRTMNLAQFVEQRFPLPPVEEQRRIVARIEALSTKIREASTLVAEVERQCQSVAQALAHRRDLDDATKARAGWCKHSLRDLMSQSKQVVAVDAIEEYPNVGVYSYARGLFRKPPITGTSTSAKALIPIHAGQFIYSRLFAFEGAYAYVTPEFSSSYVSNEFPVFDCDPSRATAEFVYSYFLSPDVWRTVATGSKGIGHRRQRVQPEQILSHELMVPTLAEQRRIVAYLGSLSANAESLKSLQHQSAAELDALLPSILDRAFAGGL